MGRRGGRGWECTPMGVQLGRASQISNKDRQARGDGENLGQASPSPQSGKLDRQSTHKPLPVLTLGE
jgi:hypothetical protein